MTPTVGTATAWCCVSLDVEGRAKASPNENFTSEEMAYLHAMPSAGLNKKGS